MDCLMSSQVLINIFEHNTPLHDGAIIVRGDRIVSATCYLPLTDNMGISKELGTRHRAAVGMSEVSDALIVVVSEETGAVSVAQGGQISGIFLKKNCGKADRDSGQKTEYNRIVAWWKGRRKDERKLTRNLGLKVLAFLIASFTWLLVVNTDDPETDKTYTNIPVKVVNTEFIRIITAPIRFWTVRRKWM